MSGTGGAVFWSYARDDDKLDDGNIVQLARRLADEFALLTGAELDLFVDRDVEWGEQWRNRIDEALLATTFFIPILTPRFFSRQECRNECIAFHAKAQGAGLPELLMPILYAPVPALEDTNDDELVATIARYQYEDWTSLRLESPSSPVYRHSVHRLAKRLVDATATVVNRQLEQEIAATQEDVTERAGLAELAEDINQRATALLAAFERRVVGSAQYQATIQLYTEKLQKLEGQRGQGGARFAVLQRFAAEDLQLAEREREDSLTYGRLHLELEPLVDRAFQILRQHPDDAALLEPFWQALDEAGRQIHQLQQETERGHTAASEFWSERKHLSRLAQRAYETYKDAEERIKEINTAVVRWLEARERFESNATD